MVLDPMLNLTSVDPRVTGPQLRYLDASIQRVQGVVQQVNPVKVAFADAYPALQGHQDGGDSFLGDVAPFDTMRERSDDRSSRIRDRVVLQVKR